MEENKEELVAEETEEEKKHYSAKREKKQDKSLSEIKKDEKEKKKDGIIKKTGKKLLFKIIIFLMIILIIFAVIGGILLKEKWYEWFPESNGKGIVADVVMGYNGTKVENVILKKSKEKSELVVLEQEVEVENKISRALLNFSVFKKTKTIHTFGTGVFTVDLSEINENDIFIDHQSKTVVITVPAPKLSYIDIDNEKTQFEDTERAFLAFGDIKLTQEQQNVVDKEIDSALEKALSKESILEKADKSAVKAVSNFLAPFIDEISDKYELKVVLNEN